MSLEEEADSVKKIKIWLMAVRAPFFTASLIPVLVGTALSSRLGNFHFIKLLFALFIVVSCHAGANLINDYFDAIGSDPLNQSPTPFSGGSRLIQQGVLSRKAYYKGANILYGVAFLTVSILTIAYQNLGILLLGAAGIIIGVIYSASKTFGMGRGWGELAVGMGFGPLATAGSFLLQTNFLIPEAFLAGVPVGFLIMGVLILNEFPDVEADRAVNKRNWIVRAGEVTRGVWIYLAVISLAYFTLIAGVFWGVFPAKILVSCFTIPLAVWILLKIHQYRGNNPEIIPVLAGNIGLHFITGILITVGLWWK
jgi:1,4-dihydroxy-2-naphthoate octaprenyltransferase